MKPLARTLVRRGLVFRQRLHHRPPPLAENLFLRRKNTFIGNLDSVLEENYSNPHFNVPCLCLALNMTRSSLYRKLVALTGKNIEAYIRTYRLKKAYEQLKTTDLAVKEVAWNCGFHDPAHFSRVFHAEFGFPPTGLRF